MIKLGLIGYPLGHSLSPKLHEAALKSCGLYGNYSLFEIHLDDKQRLQDLLTSVRNGEITGINVTIPHKQNVIPMLDDLTPTASTIGAVNTIYLEKDRLVGDNTDAPGFLADLKKLLPTDMQRNRDACALVLGAGGSARAVVYALLNDGWNINLAARRIDQARQLATSFANYELSRSIPLRPIALFSLVNADTNLSNLQSPISLIINTTPLGMAPDIDNSPWPENLPFPPHAAIYDLVYNPRMTKLVSDARRQGLQATTGLGMLVEQAALAFEMWTGHRPSREVMFASAEHSPTLAPDAHRPGGSVPGSAGVSNL